MCEVSARNTGGIFLWHLWILLT